MENKIYENIKFTQNPIGIIIGLWIIQEKVFLKGDRKGCV